MARRICVIGNTNIDLVMGPLDDWPEKGTEVFLPRSDFRVGGSAANTALVLSRLGAVAGLVSAVGADAGGEMLAARFDGPLDRVPVLACPTGISVGVLHSGAERTFLSFNGHLDRLDFSLFQDGLRDWPLNGSLALVSGAFALEALRPRHREFLELLRAAGAELAIDPGWPGQGWTDEVRGEMRRWLGLADHVLLNDKEVVGLSGADSIQGAFDLLIPELLPQARLVVKCGAEGAVCRWREGEAAARAIPVEPFDTVGAGDAFNAGYLAAVAEGCWVQAALERGNAVAARVIGEFPRPDDAIAV